jgi:hypothetical protein
LPIRLPDFKHIDSFSEESGWQPNRRGDLHMVTALGASATAAASVLHDSIENPAAAEIGLAVIEGRNKDSGDREVGAFGAMPGDAQHG